MRKSVLFLLCTVTVIGLFCTGQVCGQITNIDDFLEKCPTEDPAFATMTNDFTILKDGNSVTEFPCSSPISQLPISQYTDTLVFLQGLRVMYHMDRGLANHLPWTSGTLYDWILCLKIVS